MTDDHPPLPEGISKGLQDILLRCFQKDEKMRITAKKLLQHPWISRSESVNTSIFIYLNVCIVEFR